MVRIKEKENKKKVALLYIDYFRSRLLVSMEKISVMYF